MKSEILKQIIDPFYTTKKGKKVGLGLSLLSQAAQQTGGDLKIDSKERGGTRITVVFNSSHPDMIPIGNILETLKVLVIGNPDIRFIYKYRSIDQSIHFDSLKN